MRSSRAVWEAPAVPSSIAQLLGEGNSGPVDTMVMAQRLHSYKGLAQEPYFKSKHTAASAKARPGDAAEMVQLRKKAAAMGRDFQSLLTAHERQETAGMGLRQQVRALRQELEGREKALELARRTVERLSGEKGQLEATAAGTQAYVRRLEGRLLSVRHAAELEQHCGQLKSQLDQQTHALAEAEARAGAAEEARAAAQLDVACLKRGLELAAEQLTRSAGAEVPCTLLRAVARGQEEALGLSVQLSDAKQQVSQLAAALESARQHLQAQQAALAAQQAERAELAQRAQDAEAALEKQQAVTTELRRVMDALRPKAGALAEERDELRQQLELARTEAAEAQKEAKQLRGSLKQKATIESALRDELRRVLAGEGATPSPLAPLAQAAGPNSVRRSAAAPAAAGVTPSRSGSRAGSNSQQKKQGSAAVQPSKRLASPLPPAARDKVCKAGMRQASAWEEDPRSAGIGAAAGDAGGLILADASPTRALLRLQEQRRHQQGSRLGTQQPPPYQQQEQQRPSWEDAAGSWQRQLGAKAGGDLLSPPSSSSGPSGRQPHAAKAAATAKAAAAAVLPVQDSRLMQLYSSALDEQIALLESDLAQLGGDGASSPITQLCKQAAAAATVGPGSKPPPLALPAAGQQVPLSEAAVEQQQQAAAISAWRPNGAFAEEPAAPGGCGESYRGMQQLLSPGGPTPGPGAGPLLGGGNDENPVPSVWHSNPLAGSPPPKRLQLAAHQQPAAPGADGATTVRALNSMAAVTDSAAASLAMPVPAVADAAAVASLQGSAQEGDEEWQWEGSAAASSPSLRLPASEPASESGGQQEVQRHSAGQAGAGQQRPAGSKGSCGAAGGGGGVESLSQRWDLPSPGAGNSDWLSNEWEADIEELEVNSSQTPLRKQQAALAAAATAAASPAAGGTCNYVEWQPWQQADGGFVEGPPSSGDGASRWGSSEVGDELMPWDNPSPDRQRRRAPPLLPGLPLVANSPQPPAPVVPPSPPHQRQLAPPQGEPLHTLFDLAGMDMSDLL